MVGKVKCLVDLAELLVGCLEGSVLKVNISEVLNKKGGNSVFGLQVILGGYLFVSVPCMFQIYCGTIYKLA